jgi:hypothetical protein
VNKEIITRVSHLERSKSVFRVISIIIILMMACFAHAGVLGDIDGNNQIGLPEATYALQVVAGIRTPMAT